MLFINEIFINIHLIEILVTLAEMQEILYFPEKERNGVKVLRLRSITFKHAMLRKIHFPNKLKNFTKRKYLGSNTIH